MISFLVQIKNEIYIFGNQVAARIQIYLKTRDKSFYIVSLVFVIYFLFYKMNSIIKSQ